MPAKQQNKEPSRVQPIESPRASLALAGMLAWGYVLLLLLGYVIFRMPGTQVRGNEISAERAAFIVSNAGTLTGFQFTRAIDEYRWPGQWMIFVLTIIGTLFSLIVGGIAVTRILRLPYSDWQIVISAIVAEGIAIAIGAAALWHRDQPVLASVFEAASAFGNSGVWMGERDTPTSWIVHGVLLPLAVLGGLGLPVLLDVGAAVTLRRRLSNHSVTVLWTAAAVYLLGLLAVFALQSGTSGISARAIAASSATCLNAHTAGLPIGYASQLTRPTQWIVIILMAIGASPGGAGGGVKSTTIAVIARGAGSTFLGKIPGRLFTIAMAWIAVYGLLVFGCLLMLLQSEPDLEADRLLFIAVSAASNVGLSHDRLAIAGGGQVTLCVTMLLGRFLPLAVLWWTAFAVRDADVAVG